VGSPGILAEYACRYPFTISGVADAKFFSIGIGSHTPIGYSAQQMRDMGWNLELSKSDVPCVRWSRLIGIVMLLAHQGAQDAQEIHTGVSTTSP
jgi:hypothetical protein